MNIGKIINSKSIDSHRLLLGLEQIKLLPQYSTRCHHHKVEVHCVVHNGTSEEWSHGTRHTRLHTVSSQLSTILAKLQHSTQTNG